MLRNGLEPLHLLVLLLVVLLLFGAKRLPDLAKSVGQSMRILKNEVRDLRDPSDGTAASSDETPGPVQPRD